MLYQNVSRYGLATHLALAAALPAALAQFVSDVSLAVSMLWVSLAAALWILLEPSVFSGETISTARRRVMMHVARDPLAWFFGVATLFAFVRWLNASVRLVFDAESATWTVAQESLTFLPASLGDAGLFPLALVVSMGVVTLGVKHALGRNARIWFGIATGAVSAIGGCAAAVNVAMKVEPFLTSALSGFGAASFQGSMFALFLPTTIACGFLAEECKMTKSRLVFAWAVAGNGVGAYLFLPGILCAAYFFVSVLIAIIALVILKIHSGAAAAARAASMLAFGVVLAVFSVILPSFSDVQAAKADGFDVEKAFTPALADRNEALARISKAIWLDHPWSGGGVGAFVLQAPFFASKEDWTVLPPQPSVGPNGYFTLIAERGIAGALLWIIGMALLLYFWVSRLVSSLIWQKQQNEGQSWILNVPVVVWAGPLVLLAGLGDAFFSSGFPLTAVSACVTVAMPLAAASFPKVKRGFAHEDDKR